MQWRYKQPLAIACREAQASCEFAGAFWLAAQCARALEPVAALRVAEEMGQSASMLYAGTIQHLEAALSAVCADFRADQYAKASHRQSFPLARCPIKHFGTARQTLPSQQLQLWKLLSDNQVSRVSAKSAWAVQVLEGYVYLGARGSLSRWCAASSWRVLAWKTGRARLPSLASWSSCCQPTSSGPAWHRWACCCCSLARQAAACALPLRLPTWQLVSCRACCA